MLIQLQNLLGNSKNYKIPIISKKDAEFCSFSP